MAFTQGLSGLAAASANLDVIGNNIANSGTIGFKSGSVTFQDVYAGSQAGLGTQVAGVLQNFSAGAVQTSTRALDVAIVGGDGFFRMASPSGEIAYARNGQFDVDKNGYIVNSSGLRLTGFQPTANGTVAGGSPTALQVPTGAMPPAATQKITAQFNIDARATIPTASPFDANNASSYNYSNTVTVFDSLGNSHEMSTFFVKTGVNTWNAYGTADGKPLTSTGIATAVPPATPVAGSLGALTFDGSGQLTAPLPAVSVAGLNFGNGSSPMGFTVDITGTTQFGTVNDVKKLTQDGYKAGQLSTFTFNQDGTLTGKYSNEQSKALGQVVLSSFVNPGGLQPKGDNVWAETSVSGQPLTGTPGSGTKLGALVGGALESSNVDLTIELINLIIAQRTYQANAQTIKTQDQAVQTLINMR